MHNEYPRTDNRLTPPTAWVSKDHPNLKLAAHLAANSGSGVMVGDTFTENALCGEPAPWIYWAARLDAKRPNNYCVQCYVIAKLNGWI